MVRTLDLPNDELETGILSTLVGVFVCGMHPWFNCTTNKNISNQKTQNRNTTFHTKTSFQTLMTKGAAGDLGHGV